MSMCAPGLLGDFLLQTQTRDEGKYHENPTSPVLLQIQYTCQYRIELSLDFLRSLQSLHHTFPWRIYWQNDSRRARTRFSKRIGRRMRTKRKTRRTWWVMGLNSGKKHVLCVYSYGRHLYIWKTQIYIYIYRTKYTLTWEHHGYSGWSIQMLDVRLNGLTTSLEVSSSKTWGCEMGSYLPKHLARVGCFFC